MKNGSVTLLFVLMAGFAPAIVVQDYSVATNAPSGDWDLNWNYIYNYKQSSAVAVGEYWILTAAHVADDPPSGDLSIGATTYYQQEIIYHSSADLALVRYDKPMPGFYPLYTGLFLIDDEMILVGFGNTGTVTDAKGAFAQDYYTDSGSGRGTKRWGTQAYSSPDTQTYTLLPLTTTSTGFQMGFRVGDTPYEAGVGIYDSGGGTFIEDGKVWKVAGINTSRYGTETNYTGTFAVSVPAYTNWILQAMDAVTGDTNNDGIPNWWEEQYGTNIVAGADQDGDGVNGLDEYIADTDPTDGNSFFRIEGAISSSEQTFTFEGSTARQYQLLYTTNDLAATNLVWITNGVPVWGEGAATEIAITNTEEMVFYRMEAMLP